MRSRRAAALLAVDRVETVREPMFLLLLGAGTRYLVFGDLQEGLTLFGFVIVTVALTLYQEGKTELAIEALRDLTSPRALVIRDGQPKRIAGRDVVRGDLLKLSEGDRVRADALLVSADGVRADESLLTGEPFRWASGWQSPMNWLSRRGLSTLLALRLAVTTCRRSTPAR